MACKKSTQFAVNGMLPLPSHTPDIDFLLRVTSTPIIERTIILDKQISFSGHVNICIEFVSSDFSSTKTVHFISFESPFIGIIHHCCAKSGMDCQLEASIKHQELHLTTDKCINKLIVIRVCIVKLRKSCINSNCHRSEPRLTLLCTPENLKPCRTTCHATHPITSKDDYDEMPPFRDFHFPSSQQLDPSDSTNCCQDHDSTASYNTCDYQDEQE